MPNSKFQITFLKTVEDDFGRLHHNFKAKMDGTTFRFSLSEDGKNIMMGSKPFFFKLPTDVQNQMADEARRLLGNTHKSDLSENPASKFQVIFLKTGKDDCGRIRHEFELQLNDRPHTFFDFALSEDGKRTVMGSKSFLDLPLSLQDEIATAARALIPR